LSNYIKFIKLFNELHFPLRGRRQRIYIFLFDLEDEKLRIYSEEQQNYDVVGFKEDREFEDGGFVTVFKLVDAKGKECFMSLSLLKNKAFDAILIVSYTGKYSYSYKMINSK